MAAPLKKSGPIAAKARQFQPEAVELEERPLPGASRLSLYLLVIMLAAGLIWAGVSQVDRIVTAQGKLITTAPTIMVQPLDTAVIRSLEVEEGQAVRQGQVLATLDPTFNQADISQLGSRLGSFTSQIARLETELAGGEFKAPNPASSHDQLQAQLLARRRATRQARLEAYDQSLRSLQSALADNLAEQKLLAQRLKGLREIEQMRAALHAERQESKLALLEARNQRLEVEGALEQATSQARQLQHQLAKTRAEKDAFNQTWRQEATEELVQARRERDYLNEQLLKAQHRGEMEVLRSPARARVLKIAQRSAGSVVRPAEPLFTLVPLGSPLEAEVRLETADIGFVRAGDQVRIKLDAFPFQKHGLASGKVASISGDAMQGQSGPPFYVARVTLLKTELRQVPPDFHLLPGMTVTAEILVGQRTVLSYLAYPLLRGLQEGLREP